MDSPLVSIVTPSYNSSRFIERTILSVLQQDYPHIEHIVIDGGSTDGTVDILRRFPHVQWISEPDRGQSDALNKGFRRARGDIIGWLNADDTYNPGAVAAAVAYLQQHPDVAVVYSHCNVMDENDQLLYCLTAPPFDLVRNLLEYRLPQPAAFIRAEALVTVGYLDESLHYVMDRDLFMRLGLRYRLDTVDAVWANFRECAGTKTVSHPERFWLETIRVFNRFFQTPELPVAALRVKAQAYARVYWMAGILLQASDSGEARTQGNAYCAQALQTYPLLTRDYEFVAGQVIHCALTRCLAEEGEHYVTTLANTLEAPLALKRRIQQR